MANLETLELTINANAGSATGGIDSLTKSLSALATAVEKAATGMGRLNLQLRGIKSFSMQPSQKIGKEIQESANRRVNPEEIMGRVNTPNKSDLVYAKAQTTLAELTDKAGKGQLSEKQIASQALQVKNLTEQYENLAEKENAVTEGVKETASTFGKIKEGFSNLTKGASGFFGKVSRIATSMLIRKAIRGLIASIKEGVSNFYEWSKLNNGAFAASVDNLKSKTAQLKNTMGAAIAPVIAAAIPVINSLASAAITAFNAVSQLIALLTGSGSWTKATQGANDFAEAASGAGGAASDWLAAFDELNVMSSGGGGGGGGGALDFSNMFEEVYAFDEKIRAIADFIKRNFESIKGIALAIGAAILAWRISEAFAETLPILSKIAGLVGVGAVIAITLQADWVLTNEYLNTGKEGWLIASALTTAVGSTIAWAMTKKLLGGQAAAYAAALTLTLSAITDIVALVKNTNVTALSKESILTSIKAALSAGAGYGILLKTVGGASGAVALHGAAGAALITFGVAIGLKAILEAKQTEFVPMYAITSALLAAAPIGLGMMVLGSPVGMAAGAVFATFGAVVGLKAILSKDKIEWDTKTRILNALLAAAPVGIGSALMGAGVFGGIAAAFATFGVVIALSLIAPKEKITWGNVSLTESQIRDFVNEYMFSTPVDVLINQINAIFTDKENLEKDIEQKIQTLKTEYNVLKLGVDKQSTYSNLANQLGGEDGTGGLLKEVSDLCDMNIDALKLTFGNITAYDGQGNVITSDVLLSGMEGWNKVKSEMEANGKELTELLMKGARGELSPEMEAYTEQLLQEVMEMQRKIANATEFGEAMAEFQEKALAAFSQNSFEGITSAFKEYSASYEATIRKALKAEIAGWYTLADLEEDPELKAKYKKIADDLSAGFEQTVSEELKTKTAPGVELIRDWVLGNHGEPITWDRDLLELVLNPDDLAETVASIFMGEGFTTEEIDLINFIGFSWDLLSKQLQKDLLKSIKISPETIANIKSVGVPADDIVKVIKWDTFTTDRKYEFLRALKESFGSKAVVSAAKNAGIDLGAMIREGMASKDPAIRKQAEQWDRIINDELKDPHDIKVKEEKNSTKQTVDSIANEISNITSTVHAKAGFTEGHPKNLETTIEGMKPKLPTAAVFEKGSPNNLKTGIESQKPVVTSTTKFASGYPGNLKSSVEALKPNMTAKVNVNSSAVKSSIESIHPTVTANVVANSGGIAALSSAIKSAIRGTITVKAGGSTISRVHVAAYANGGVVDSGSLFVANENGKSEMIGKFGSHAAVANQEQMVEAMARGVQYAQSEQNGLLREQNNLLRGILQKTGNNQFGISSALGRTVKQSLDMYNMATGVG